MGEGTVLGRMTGRVMFESNSKSEAEEWALRRRETRLILLRSRRQFESNWCIVDVSGCVFEWSNSSGSESGANVHVSEGGWVSLTEDVEKGDELVWCYGDKFCI